MSWNTIAAADVLAEFTPAEQVALESVQGVSTTLAAILTRTINMARGQIAAGGYALGDAGTVPDQLAGDIIAIARWRWLTSLPSMPDLQTKPRQDAHDEAQKRLEAVANQKLNIENPSSTSAPAGNWNSENKIVPRGHPIAKPGSQFTPKPNDYANPDGPEDANLQ